MTLINLNPVQEEEKTEAEILAELEAKQEAWNTKKTEMVAKAKEILTDNGAMHSGDLADVLQFFYVYGKMPEIIKGVPQITGNNIKKVNEDYESQHYTSAQLNEVIQQLISDLSPKTEE